MKDEKEIGRGTGDKGNVAAYDMAVGLVNGGQSLGKYDIAPENVEKVGRGNY